MEPKDEIKSRLDIVDLVSEYIPLKPAGSGNFKGLCPFHNEKTPSFHVSREKEIWHCFGCDKGGDMISFVMEMDGMSFPEALRHLGGKAGVEIPEYKPEPDADKKQVLRGLHTIAGRFYETLLHRHPEGEVARKYIERRGIDSESAKKFRIGFAPGRWESLVMFLRSRGATDTQIVEAGLAKPRQSGNGLFDRFRTRLMIPLCDARGNIVGFTGRILKEDEKAPKYLNSPETEIYHKSEILFGLHLAKPAIRQQKSVIIVEGNLDVIASHKAGIEHVIASSGTALTESQIRQLGKLTKCLIFAFDSDAAGFEAARRGIRLAQSMSLDVRVIQIANEDGKDPDDVVQKSPERWRNLAESPVHVMEYYFSKGLADFDITDIDGKRGLARFILEEVGRLQDMLDQEHWLQKLSDIVHVDISVLRRSLEKTTKKVEGKNRVNDDTSEAESRSKITTQEDQASSLLIGLALTDESFMEEIIPRLKEEFLSNNWRNIYKKMVLRYNQHKSENNAQNTFFSKFQDHLSTSESEEVQTRLNGSVMRAQEVIGELSRDQVREEISRHISLLVSKSQDAKRKQLESAIRQAELSGDTDRLKALIEQYSKLLG